ncbi:MAG TPA: redoxin domain-containing protein [Chloroflexota bacterium]|nr:redoxin domain-containing protein [Chloroflexota bacterium]
MSRIAHRRRLRAGLIRAALASHRERGRLEQGRVPDRYWLFLPFATLAIGVLVLLLLRPARSTGSLAMASDFKLPAVSGAHGMLDVRDLRGHPVLINFFNTQCPPCIAEMPTLRQTARLYQRQGLIVLGVATGGDTAESARQFARVQHLSYPVVVDLSQDVAWQYEVVGWPTSVFLDREGHLAGRFMGPLDAQTIREGLAQAGAISCPRCDHLGGLIAVPDSILSTDVTYPDPHAAPAFALRDQNGVLITPSRLRGKVVALTFVSSVCTQQCPMVGRTLGQIRRQLGPAAGHFTIVAISIAPERDTAATIQGFAAHAGWLGGNWHYLTASRAILSQVWSAYGVPVGLPGGPGQDPQHMAGLYFLDPRGNLRGYDDAPFLAPRVEKTVRALLSRE